MRIEEFHLTPGSARRGKAFSLKDALRPPDLAKLTLGRAVDAMDMVDEVDICRRTG